eukprot:1319427-Amorphochlora_amoeboformis.AAC.1
MHVPKHLAGNRWRFRRFLEIVSFGSNQQYPRVTGLPSIRTLAKIEVGSRSWNVPRNFLNELAENFPFIICDDPNGLQSNLYYTWTTIC